MPLPSPQGQQLIETHFYLGSNGGVQPYKIDHRTSQVTKLNFISMGLAQVGWVNWIPDSLRFLAIDANSYKRFTTFSLNAQGQGTAVSPSTNGPADVHSTLVKNARNRYFVFSTSYGRATLHKHVFDSNFVPVPNSEQVVPFAGGAKTHSSAFDSRRSLLFVANLGLNSIAIFRVDPETGQLSPIGNVDVRDPRTVIYDEVFDRVFVATEAYSGNSFIRAFAVQDLGGRVEFIDRGSQAMPLIGADIKVDRVHRFVVATAREPGKESIWGMPLTTSGDKDMTRRHFQIDVLLTQPRSLEITADGQYIMVGMNSGRVPADFRIYKVTYSASNDFVSSEMIYQNLGGTGGFMCSVSRPVFGN
jgi:6-phosphogluconolactonase (cycloisomerase 2 family)